jgi:hypothetical protein
MIRFILITFLIFSVGLRSFSQENAILFVENPAKFQNYDQKSFIEKYVSPRLYLPDSIKNKCENRFVSITFSVDTTGNTDIIDIVESYSNIVDSELTSIIKSSSGLWQPATQYGKKVKQAILLKIPISKIQKNCPEYMQLVEKSKKLYMQRNYVESVRFVNKILELNPDDQEALILRAECKIQLKEYDSACKDLNFLSTDKARELKNKINCK